MDMNEGAFRITGKHLSLALLTLVLMTLFLLDWERNPLTYTYIPTQHRSDTLLPPPACFHPDLNNSTESLEPAEMNTDGEKSQTLQEEERKEPEADVDDSETELTDGNSKNSTASMATKERLCDREPINATDPDTLYTMHLDYQPAFIHENIDRLNVLVLNTAHHWSKHMMNMDKEVMYVNGAPVRDRNLNNENTRIFKVKNIVTWLDSKMVSNPNVQVFFRTTSPRHFFKGDWNSGGTCDNTVPMTRGSEVLQEESIDKIVAASVEGTRVKILDITALSDLSDEAHISHYGKKANDC
ncbi:Detected protein of confused Function [Hibiscus syriacus]|uniref:Detected protein of confused Function n=1 Tax=Hibiscus syriacus TaxID=106335 RepID=A0A6A2ZDV4_HIBSY|nr:Detected protein of confused Function [Hibiscus syriacus]